METQNTNKTQNENYYKHPHNHRAGRIIAGLILVAAGSLLLAKQMGMFIPNWIFTWEMLLIMIGIYSGAKHSFQTKGWLIPVIIGSTFLVEEIIPGITISQYFWPLLIIGIGVFKILIPRRKWRHHHWRDCRNAANYSETSLQDDRININCVFSGVKKNVVSKDFKGGDITCVFGGAEVNLSQADINGKVILELNNIFGGTKLIVPSHWEIKSEVEVVMGGFEDKRPIQKSMMNDAEKVLVLKGSCVFGGIEIKSY